MKLKCLILISGAVSVFLYSNSYAKDAVNSFNSMSTSIVAVPALQAVVSPAAATEEPKECPKESTIELNKAVFVETSLPSVVEAKKEAKVDIKLENKIETKIESRNETKQEAKVEQKIEPKLEAKPELKTEIKLEPKTETNQEAKLETKKEKLKSVVDVVVDAVRSLASVDPVSEKAPSLGPIPVVVHPEGRPWRAPDYSNQKEALGYPTDAFAIPKGMESQVHFWISIYTKYSTEEGVIHDMENLENIYDVVDLKGIKTDKERQKKIDDAKKAVALRLNLDEETESRLRFQLGQKNRMYEGVFHSGRYLEDMEKVFTEAKLPKELTRLAFVESAFNVMARSKVGASGIWQIMPYTARPYRMISAAVDKRNHPLEATRLAAKLLRQNYSMLESWPLAITGYNHGPSGVRKLTHEYKSRDLTHLIETVDSRRSFGFASRNFYACFLAALEVERNAKKYFPDVVWAKPYEVHSIKLPTATKYSELVGWFDGDHSKAQLFNPHLTLNVTKKGYAIPVHTVISIPKEKANEAQGAYATKGRAIASDKKLSRR